MNSAFVKDKDCMDVHLPILYWYSAHHPLLQGDSSWSIWSEEDLHHGFAPAARILLLPAAWRPDPVPSERWASLPRKATGDREHAATSLILPRTRGHFSAKLSGSMSTVCLVNAWTTTGFIYIYMHDAYQHII